MKHNDEHETASKYQVEINSKYSYFTKQGNSNGENTKQNILNAIQEQANNKKESE